MRSDTPLLKDCPFCGETVGFTRWVGDKVSVCCATDGCIRLGPEATCPDYPDAGPAIAVWNTRSTQPEFTDEQIRRAGYDPEEFRKCMRGEFPEFPPTDTDSGTVKPPSEERNS